MKKVVIVEKVKNIREGIRILINRFSNLECVGTYEHFKNFLEEIEIVQPEILLLDFDDKNQNILGNIRELKLNYPGINIILLTMNEENDKIFDALSHGAIAYVHKTSPTQRLIKTIDDTALKRISINSVIARKAINHIEKNNLTSNFNVIERELLKMVTEGNNLPSIEKQFKMEVDMIKEHYWNIIEKIFEEKSRVLRVDKY